MEKQIDIIEFIWIFEEIILVVSYKECFIGAVLYQIPPHPHHRRTPFGVRYSSTGGDGSADSKAKQFRRRKLFIRLTSSFPYTLTLTFRSKELRKEAIIYQKRFYHSPLFLKCSQCVPLYECIIAGHLFFKFMLQRRIHKSKK